MSSIKYCKGEKAQVRKTKYKKREEGYGSTHTPVSTVGLLTETFPIYGRTVAMSHYIVLLRLHIACHKESHTHNAQYEHGTKQILENQRV